MTVRRGWLVLLALLAPLAQAATPSTGSGQGPHAFLDRSHVSLGDTVTLNIQTDGALGSPELSSLQKDFEVLGTSRSSSVQIVNGKTTSTTQLGIALKPLHAGTLTIPALDIGGGATQPLTLHVGAAPSGGTGKAGDPVFMETNVQSSSPYVGQQTVYTVRLFYLPGVDGALGNPSAGGARLVPLDRDHRYVTQRDGFTYKVIERSWALIPQRSGSIAVQGPVFEGQRLDAGFPNAWFNNPNALPNSPLQGFGGTVRATAPAARIDARAEPAGAGKPWLPARNVQLKLTGLPSDGKLDAAAPLTITLSISASGQPADALPEPELPTIAGARVYPDRTQDTTDDSGEWLQGTRTRSFAIVPDRNGTIAIPAITLDWWDTSHDRAEQAGVPAHVLAVSGVSASVPAPPVVSNAEPVAQATRATASDRGASVPGGRWRDLALASFALWAIVIVAALAWWLIRRRARHAKGPSSGRAGSRTEAGSTPSVVARLDASPEQPDARALQKRTLDAARAGDAAACERTLLAWARVSRPAMAHAGLLRDALADPEQHAALDGLQRVRWQGGDPAPACAAVVRAFAHGFAWREDERHKGAGENGLPPLYPSS
ncbi:MAG: protein BatD [Xanthomonadales bacterium]|nr:protein BatD [Xanthomonadales bacterium]